MKEGVVSSSSTHTFPMLRESDSASRLKSIITDMLPLFSDDIYGEVLSEYITVIVCHGKSQKQVRVDLDAFLGEKESCEFVACLWEVLVKEFSQEKQESEVKTVVDCGSLDTPVEQGLSSTRDNNSHEQRDTKVAYRMNEKLIQDTAPVEDTEVHVSPKVKNMKMLRQKLVNSPCKRVKRKKKDDWNSSGVNYSRKVLRSIVVSSNKQPCGIESDRYGKCMKERSGMLQNLLYTSARETRKCNSQSVHLDNLSGRPVSPRSHDADSYQEMKPHVSVWDRLDRPRSSGALERLSPWLPNFGIETDENNLFQQYGPAFPAAYIEREVPAAYIEREVPAVAYFHGSKSHRATQPKSGTIMSTEPDMAYNLNRKRRYGIIDRDVPVCEFGSSRQYKQAKQDVENPSLISNQSAKPDLFSEIENLKQKLKQLEVHILQAKKKKIRDLKRSQQSGKTLQLQDVKETRTIHVTNVHYAANKEAILMFFSKCGVVENVTVVTNPVLQLPKGAAFVTFATNESVDKAIALNDTMFYSRPIKVQRHVIASEAMSETPATQVVT